jgi:hypothetical protein
LRGAVLGFELAANLGVRRGENKDLVPVDLDPGIPPVMRTRQVTDPGLQGPLRPLHGHLDEVGLSGKAVEQDPARTAEAGRLHTDTLRPNAHARLRSPGEMRRWKDADRSQNLPIPHHALDLIEVTENARRKEVGGPQAAIFREFKQFPVKWIRFTVDNASKETTRVYSHINGNKSGAAGETDPGPEFR